jgi:hypothetical protein
MDGPVDTSRNAFIAQASELVKTQRAEEAETLIREGLRRYPGDGDIQSWLPYALLMQGRYRDGFREYEARYARQATIAAKMPLPEWDGPIAGRSIFVMGEGGIGDEIQTARYIPRLRELGARNIAVACYPENLRLFRELGADVVTSRIVERLALPESDCWVRSWSLPYRLGVELAEVDGAPYLSVDTPKTGGIGLVERGNPKNPRDDDRSAPHGSLQALVPGAQVLTPSGDTLDSLKRLAGLDLLITVDTSWAHMAGALGLPCWLLLPFRQLDWRWLRERSDSPWYSSLRLFRQPAPADWDSVLAAVKLALQELEIG